MKKIIVFCILLLTVGTGGSTSSADMNWEIISQDPSPLTQDAFFDVWCISENDVYALTRSSIRHYGWIGAVYHYDGTGWSIISSYSGYSIWASGPADIYVLTEKYTGKGSYIHFNGSKWEKLTIDGGARLYDVWGSAADDVFITGSSGQIFHFDGNQWQTMDIGTDKAVSYIWGTSAQDVFAVTSDQVLHFNGEKWTSFSMGLSFENTPSFNSVWGSSASDVFVSGECSVYHYDGSKWELMHSDDLCQNRKIWGASATDVYLLLSYDGAIRHYDGQEWNQIETGMTVSLRSIHGSGSDNIIAVGDSGHIQKFDGKNWQVMVSATGINNLYDVRGSSQNDIYAVGERGRVLHFNGNQWDEIVVGVHSKLNALWVLDPDNVYIAGKNGVLLNFNGEEWRQISLPLEPQISHPLNEKTELTDIWASGEDNIFVSGEAGVILHFDGSEWSLMDIPNTSYADSSYGTIYQQKFFSLWGSSPSSVYATGFNIFSTIDGEIYFAPKHYNGVEWQNWKFHITDSESDIALKGTYYTKLWGTSETDLYYFSDLGYGLYHFDGEQWTWTGFSSSVLDMWGASSDDIFLVNDYAGIGGIAHYDGLNWQDMEIENDRGLNAVWGSSSNDVYAVGDDNTILHYTEIPADDSTDDTGTSDDNGGGGSCFLNTMKHSRLF